MGFAEMDQQTVKAAEGFILIPLVPQKPVQLVVLAPSVIIPISCVPILIAHQEHGSSYRKHQGGVEVAHLPLTQVEDFVVRGLPFRAAIPALVVIGSIPIVLPILDVVFILIGDKVF